MVKERRAMADEAVNIRAPEEGLRLTERPTESYAGNIEAEKNRAGLWMSPSVFKDLAAISEDVHDTRRHSRANDFAVNLNKQANDYAFFSQQEELYRTRLLNTEHTNLSLRLQTDLAETHDKATKENLNLVTEYEKLRERWRTDIDKIYEENPGLGQAFDKTFENSYLEARNKAYEFEFSKAEKAKEFTIDKATSLACANIFTGSGEDLLDRNIVRMGQQVIPLLDGNTDADYALANEKYNTLVGAYIDKIVAMAEEGSVTMEQAVFALKYGIIDKYATYDLKGTRINEYGVPSEERIINVHMTEATISKCTTALDSLGKNRGQTSKAEKVYTLQAYNEMVTNPEYHINATPGTATADYQNYKKALIKDMGSGSEDTSKQLYELTSKHYTETLPTVCAYELAQSELSTAGTISAAKVAIDNKITALKQDLANGEDPSKTGSLRWSNPELGVEMDLSFPEGDEDLNILRRAGVPFEKEKEQYYRTILKNLEDVRNKLDTDPDLIMKFSKPYAQQLDKAIKMLSYSILTNEDGITGTITKNPDAEQKAITALTEANILGRAAAGKDTIGSSPSALLRAITAQANVLNPKQRSIYMSTMASIFKKAGYGDAFLTYKTQNATPEEEKVIQELGTWEMLQASDDTSLDLSRIQKRALDSNSPTTLSDEYMNSKLRDKLDNANEDTFMEDVEATLNEHQVPIEFRPFVRNAIKELAYAKVLSPRDDGSERDENLDMDDIRSFVSNRFTEKGIPKFLNTIANADKLQTALTDTEETMQHSLKKLGMDNVLTLKMNYETGRAEVWIDGKPVLGSGNYKNLLGTGVVPFTLDLTTKPVDMSWEQFYEAQKPVLAMMPVTIAFTKIEDNAVFMKRMLDMGYSTEDIAEIKKYGLQLAAVMGNQDIMNEYYTYRLSGNKSAEVASAPIFLKDAIIKGTNLAEEGNLPNDISNFIDFMWARQGVTKLRTDVPGSLPYELNGTPKTDIEIPLNKIGLGFTSTTGGKHVPNSKHGKGLAADIGDISGKGFYATFIDPITGDLKGSVMKGFYDSFLEPQCKEKSIERILTGYPYLDPRRPESKDPRYKEFQYLRDLKNKDGKPVFRYIDPFKLDGKTIDHKDHFHVEFYDKTFDPRTGKAINTKYTEENKKKMGQVLFTNINTSRKYGTITQEEARAIPAFSKKYELTEWDAKNVGVPLDELKSNPMGQEFAVAALYGKTKSFLGADVARFITVKGISGIEFDLQWKTEGAHLLKDSEGLSIQDLLDANDRLKARGLNLKNYCNIHLRITDNVKLGHGHAQAVHERNKHNVSHNYALTLFEKEMFK